MSSARGQLHETLQKAICLHNWSSLPKSHNHLDWPRLSYSEQFKEGDEEADRGNDGKTTSKSRLALSGISYYGKLRTAKSGGSWL